MIDTVTCDDRTRRVQERVFARFALEPTVSDGPASCTIRLEPRAGRRCPPGALAEFPLDEGMAYQFADGLCIEAGGALVRSTPSSRVVTVWLSEAVERPSVGGLGVLNGMQAALRRCGLFDLHAAAVTPPGAASSILLMGGKGAGKSTLTIRLADCGWRYLSDDQVLLSADETQIHAIGLRRLFAVEAFCLEAPGAPRGLVVRGPVPFNPRKVWVDPILSFPGRFAAKSAPRALVFIERTPGARSSLQRLTQANALARLLAVSPWARHDPFSARAHLKTLEQLVRQAAAWTLHAGSDLLQRGRAADFLARTLVHAA